MFVRLIDLQLNSDAILSESCTISVTTKLWRKHSILSFYSFLRKCCFHIYSRLSKYWNVFNHHFLWDSKWIDKNYDVVEMFCRFTNCATLVFLLENIFSAFWINWRNSQECWISGSDLHICFSCQGFLSVCLNSAEIIFACYNKQYWLKLVFCGVCCW